MNVISGRPFNSGYLLGSSGTASAVSSGTAETPLAQITIPAGAMGLNGSVRITTLWSYTNSANIKTIRIRFGGSGGTQYVARTETTSVSIYVQAWIWNNGVANAQKSNNSNSGLFALSGASAFTTSAVDTTAPVVIYISGQTATGGETITLASYTVELIPGV